MLIEVISRMDKSILELALVEAFCDMCFYEGEEFVQELEKYIADVESGQVTDEQINNFFNMAESYIDNSIMIYGAHLIEEGAGEIAVGADKANAENKSSVPADALSQIKDKSREELQKLKKFNVPANKKLTEAEELAVWEGVGQIIPSAVKEGIAKAGKKVKEIGGKMSTSVTSGIAAAQKKLQQHLINTKIGGKAAVASPEKK